MTTAAPTDTAPAPDRLDPAVLRMALVLVAGAMAPLLDSTIVNIAFGTLAHDLHTTLATVQWVGTGYLLALAMTVPLTGWAADRFGAKRMWLISLALFMIGSALCGIAWNIGSLITFRVIQGVGGGLMLPILQTMLMRAAGGKNIGRLTAVITLPALLGPILGPVLGGLIIGHLNWHWIFYVNVPVCLLAIALAWRYLPADSARSTTRLDVIGLLLLSPGVAAVIYGLAEVGDHGGFGHAAVLIPMLGGGALIALFARHALHTTEPAVDLRLFRTRSFSAASALMFTTGLSLFGSMLLLPLFYQQARGASIVMAGLLLAPQGIGSLIARAAGPLTDRLGPRPVVLLGMVCTVLGTLPFAFADRHPATLLLAGALVLRGIGLSSVNLAVLAGAYTDLNRAEIPHASSATRINQQLGGAFGAAVFAVILQSQLHAHAGAQALAFAHTFTWAVAFAAIGLLPALFMPRKKDPATAG
ncbi:DHA2 family efflux MFS transporter permease subunit [Nocardia sp. NPDC020380]|uniref:DHA2 family efflux MFS transporter permease subunit n=1 Tax=Nocardia sp. NPDC020380 TaxID=3364309 RepID=UPI0037AA55AC